MSATIAPTTSEHARRFTSDGFFVLERAVPAGDLELLRAECRRLVDDRDEEMRRLGTDRLDLDHRGWRYFLHTYDTSPQVPRFLFSDLMTQVARTALGDTVYLFNEQYVVKAAERGIRFGWHQDSGFIDYPHRPYLTCWIALDEASEANGTVYLLPYDRAGTRDVVEHVRDEETNDMIGYTGADPGDPSSFPPAASCASRAPSCTAAASTPPSRCAASTSRSTPRSRSSPRTAAHRAISPNRCSATGCGARHNDP